MQGPEQGFGASEVRQYPFATGLPEIQKNAVRLRRPVPSLQPPLASIIAHQRPHDARDEAQHDQEYACCYGHPFVIRITLAVTWVISSGVAFVGT